MSQEEKGATEDEMAGGHHRLNRHEFKQTPGDSEGEGSLACCSPWGCKESDVTERLNKQTKIIKGIGNHGVEFGIYLKANGKSLVVM